MVSGDLGGSRQKRHKLCAVKFYIAFIFMLIVFFSGIGGGVEASLKTDEVSIATRLKSVTAWSWGNYLLINVITDGIIEAYQSATITDPARIVIDFYGIEGPVRGPSSMTVDGKWASRIEYYKEPGRVRLIVTTETVYLDRFITQQTENGLLIKIGAPNQLETGSFTEGIPGLSKAPPDKADGATPEPTVDADGNLIFEIKAFEIVGNTVLDPNLLQNTLKPFTGKAKTTQDVEKARTTLERFYHQQGYVTVLVNIPEQGVETGTVQLEVIESRIRRVRITGNRFFTMQKIRRELPSFKTGNILYLPKLQAELAMLNRNPDIKVAPVLAPGKELGTIDVELKVKDKPPLHGSLEFNNRSSHNTTPYRLTARIGYENLWQKEHAFALQYQTSPEDTDEVTAIVGSYVLPAPWSRNQMLAFYALQSDSEVAADEDFNTIGEGQVAGVRHITPLPSIDRYTHSFTLCLDYKDFEDELEFSNEDEEALSTSVMYMPFSTIYNSSWTHHSGITRFRGGLNILFRELVTDEDEIEDKRYKARGNYLYVTGGIERIQKLPYDFSTLLKIDGQYAEESLISNEQYTAGGLLSVRGYKEAEAAGDKAFHSTLEIIYNFEGSRFKLGDWWGISPFIFYDYAYLIKEDILSGEDGTSLLMGAGAGVRGYLTKYLDYEFVWGRALQRTEETEYEDDRYYFVAKAKF